MRAQDPEDFIENGGWSFLDVDQSDSEEEAEEESDFAPRCVAGRERACGRRVAAGRKATAGGVGWAWALATLGSCSHAAPCPAPPLAVLAVPGAHIIWLTVELGKAAPFHMPASTAARGLLGEVSPGALTA